MSHSHDHKSGFGRDLRPSAATVWSTLLVLALAAAVLLWSYLGPRPLSPSYRATEHPDFSSKN
jgi:hypothetical protein